MVKGFPVVLSDRGAPFVAVEKNAPLATVAENGRGLPIRLVEKGAPPIILQGGAPWTPLDLFADGTDGTLWEPWDVSTLFQDNTGTTPVTAGGDPVRRVVDKSGNSVALSQSVLANSFTAVNSGSVWGIVSDYAGDVLSATLPFAISGEILIAGTGGTIIEPVSYASGSTFNLGTATYTGGTPGILRAIGPIVGVVLLDRAFTDDEKTKLIAYYKGKGAKGLLVENEIINDLSGFTASHAHSSISGMTFTTIGATAGGATHPLVVGACYKIDISASDISGDLVNLANSGAGPSARTVILASNGETVFTVPSDRSFLYLRRATEGTTTVSYISVKELRAEEDW